jgi:hypothetical protein
MTVEGLSAKVTCGRIESDAHGSGAGRLCVHLLADLPHAILLARGPVERLAVIPQVCPAPSPVLAARHGAVLTLAFDHMGPKCGRCRPGKIRHRWTYRLQIVDADTVLAIREEQS